ncbi:ATP-binding cassette domain-containing protein [Nonomuraea sp. B12E4]|uniref:ATP-binding cassette domain-containing protein n=1 Tax=Nonomuraea sp. B12E4 TaxID=3153564 RepID=UPI00325C6D69
MGTVRELVGDVEPADMTAAIEVRGLRMAYGSVEVLQGVDFAVAPGEVIALLGPNGAGNTTTIEILEGFRMSSAGVVQVLGVTPAGGDERWRARLGVVLQSWRDFHDLVHRLSDLDETTIMLTTHDLDEAEKLADRILILAGGRIVADGSADRLSREVSRDAQVRWSRGGEQFVHATQDATTFVRELFGQYGAEIGDLEVRRATLEDTYMEIVRRHEG